MCRVCVEVWASLWGEHGLRGGWLAGRMTQAGAGEARRGQAAQPLKKGQPCRATLGCWGGLWVQVAGVRLLGRAPHPAELSDAPVHACVCLWLCEGSGPENGSPLPSQGGHPSSPSALRAGPTRPSRSVPAPSPLLQHCPRLLPASALPALPLTCREPIPAPPEDVRHPVLCPPGRTVLYFIAQSTRKGLDPISLLIGL